MPNYESFNFDAAKKLDSHILFGTSSWNYPGWHGQVYHCQYKNDKDFKDNSLGEYAKFPWFRTVGIDSSFYGPPTAATLKRYSDQLPSGFRWISKVWEEITIPHYAKHKRYGSKAGTINPNFLDASLFIEKVLSQHSDLNISKHTGPFVFEFQSLPKNQRNNCTWFIEKLDCFLEKVTVHDH